MVASPRIHFGKPGPPLRQAASIVCPVLRPWLRLSAMISVGLLCAVYVVAKLTPPDFTIYEIPGVTRAWAWLKRQWPWGRNEAERPPSD